MTFVSQGGAVRVPDRVSSASPPPVRAVILQPRRHEAPVCPLGLQTSVRSSDREGETIFRLVCQDIRHVLFQIQTKQWWMVTSILVLGLTCLMASLTSMDSMSPILLVLLLLNTASAVQDICVDSLAIEILEPGELGAGNMIQASNDNSTRDQY